MTEVTVPQMEEVFAAHAQAELDCDLEAIMATVAEDPHYEFVTVGWRIDGREAVRELYRRMTATLAGRAVAPTARVTANGPNTLIQEAYLHFTQDGERRTGQHVAVITFDENGLVSGERVYQDTGGAASTRASFGEDFANFPGVSPL